MELKVEVKINPPPSKLSPDDLDKLVNGELFVFEKWFIEKQREKGNIGATGLIGVEGSILKTYVYYLVTRGDG